MNNLCGYWYVGKLFIKVRVNFFLIKYGIEYSEL